MKTHFIGRRINEFDVGKNRVNMFITLFTFLGVIKLNIEQAGVAVTWSHMILISVLILFSFWFCGLLWIRAGLFSAVKKAASEMNPVLAGIYKEVRK